MVTYGNFMIINCKTGKPFQTKVSKFQRTLVWPSGTPPPPKKKKKKPTKKPKKKKKKKIKCKSARKS